jgi:hypothetical protein
MYIYLKKDVVTNKDLTPEGLAVYIALRSLYKSDTSKYYISANMIAFLFTGCVPKRKTVESIKLGIDNLKNDMKLISIKDDDIISKDEYITDLSKLHFITGNKEADKDKDYFIIITLDEIKSIMEYKSKFVLLKYFVLLLGTFNNSNKLNSLHKISVGFTNIDNMANNFNIPKSNILSYNSILEEKKIIYIHRFNDYVKSSDGSIKSIQNFYGRYSDEKLIKTYAEQYADAIGSEKCNKKTNKKISNQKNRLLQKYNALFNGNGKYDNNEIIEIYEFIIQYNQDQDKIIDKFENDNSDYAINQVDKASKKKKDISIFNHYNFIKEDNENDGLDDLF